MTHLDKLRLALAQADELKGRIESLGLGFSDTDLKHLDDMVDGIRGKIRDRLAMAEETILSTRRAQRAVQQMQTT
jgi:hypothetical protein